MLGEVSEMVPLPVVILQLQPSAYCSDVETIRAAMNDKLDCEGGKCGEGVGWYELSGMATIG
jgi:hypothetical protein